MEIGKKYKVTRKRHGGGNSENKAIIGKVIKEYEKYFLLQTKNWKTCVLKSMITSKDYQVVEII